MATTFDIQLPHYSRGFHLITRDIISQLPALPESGLLVIFIKHTSAGLTINENADPDVRHDFQTFFNKLVPDGAPYFIHTLEGPDDMSAHIKASLIEYYYPIIFPTPSDNDRNVRPHSGYTHVSTAGVPAH